MQLTLARHPVTEIRFGAAMRLDGTTLIVDRDAISKLVLEDDSITSADFETVAPGESCRAGPIFDIIEPRAKEPGSSPDFPGILGPPLTAGIGITHILDGAAVSVLAERGPGESRSETGRFLEMSGTAANATDYSSLRHLIVALHTKPGLPNQAIEKAYRRAGVKVAVELARAALSTKPASIETFDPVSPAETGREELPRAAYIGQIFSRQRKPANDEPILYGLNNAGMLPVLLHPDEWLRGAIRS